MLIQLKLKQSSIIFLTTLHDEEATFILMDIIILMVTLGCYYFDCSRNVFYVLQERDNELWFQSIENE